MAPLVAGARIRRARVGRKHVLPHPLACGARILARERERQPDRAESFVEVDAVQLAHVRELLAQRGRDARRQHRHPILVALAVADEDLAARELDVLHAQPHRLHDAQSGAVEQRADQPMDALQACQDARHLLARQDHRQTRRHPGLLDAVEPRELDAEHLLVEEQQRALGLVLGRCGNPVAHRQRGQERLDFRRAESGRVALAMENDEASNPVAIRLLRSGCCSASAGCDPGRDRAAKPADSPPWNSAFAPPNRHGMP